MILGIDKGTAFTKNNKGEIFKSVLRREKINEIDLNNSLIHVGWEGENYIVGENGQYETNLDKAHHSNTDILVCTSIAMQSSEQVTKAKIVLGVPIAEYKKQKEMLKNRFKGKSFQISINGISKIIVFEEVEVFPEGAGAFYTADVLDAIVIDIGGLSVDVCSFQNGGLNHFETYEQGTFRLNAEIAGYLNNRFSTKLRQWDIEMIMDKGLSVDGQRVNIESAYELEKFHTEKIINDIKLDFDLKTVPNVLIAGGGGARLYKHIKEQISHAKLIDDPQLANAKGFAKVGEKLWK